MTESTNPKKHGLKHLWMVEDVPASATKEARSYWTKVGVAFENRDGSWSLELSAIPVNGRLQMREPKEKDAVAPVVTASAPTKGSSRAAA